MASKKVYIDLVAVESELAKIGVSNPNEVAQVINSKVKDIIERICEVINSNKKKVDDYFLKIVSNSINDYRAIRLIKLVDVLKKDFNIDLTNIEIFCLFTKVKPNLTTSKDADDIEEIIDYDKLKEEIENRLKQPINKKNKGSDKDKSTKAVSLFWHHIWPLFILSYTKTGINFCYRDWEYQLRDIIVLI